MSIAFKDLRFSTRRNGQAPPSLHPRLLRDDSLLARLDIAIQYFESMRGRPRRDFDAEVLVHFFGDHRLTRGLVAALARSYRFRAPSLDQALGSETAERLRRLGIASPRDLRLSLFDRVNDFGYGFLPPQQRLDVLRELAGELGLPPARLETLLHLDADGSAELIRVGAEPRPADIRAHYNLSALYSLLRYAERIVLTLRPAGEAAWRGAHRLCAANGVETSLVRRGGGATLELHGRPDALGLWSRHGARVARSVIQLLERDRAAVGDGRAELALRQRQASLKLTPELLDLLAGSPAAAGWDDPLGWDEPEQQVVPTRPALPPDCGYRRRPEPSGWGAGTLVPDLLARIGGRRVLVCGVRSLAHAERLAPIARTASAGEPLLFLGAPELLAPLAEAGAATWPCYSGQLTDLLRSLRPWFEQQRAARPTGRPTPSGGTIRSAAPVGGGPG
jgi:hypothetical protein